MMKIKRIAASALACAAVTAVCAHADFSDVSEEAYYAPYVNMLSECAILSGRGDNTFDPNAGVTRAELAKIAVMMADGSPAGGSPLFGDMSKSHWSVPYVNAAARLGIITGYTDGTFRPERGLTYAEAVTVALRMLGYGSGDLTGGYPDAYINKAAEKGLTEGLMFNPDEPISRHDAAYIFGKAFVTDKKDGSELLTSKGWSLSEECTVISSYGASVGDINTTIGSFAYSGDKSQYTGRRVKLITDSGRVKGVLPVSGKNREGGIITGISGSELSYFADGEIKTVRMLPSSSVYFEGAQTTFAAVKRDISEGDCFYFANTPSGTFDYGVIDERDSMQPTFGSNDVVNGSYTIKNSRFCYLNDIKPHDAVYYYPEENLSLVYSSTVSGVFKSAYPNKDNASSITVDGTEYSVDTSYARDGVTGLTVNDTVTVALSRNGGAAAVFKASAGAEVYGIERVIGDNIICFADGASTTLKADDNWRVIYKGKDTDFGSIKQSVDDNMQITVYRDFSGAYDYSVIEEVKLTDAIAASENARVPFDGVKSVIRDGKRAEISDIRKNDILYYNSALKTVYAYCDSISGIYEEAYPNASNPSSVKINGKIYSVETVAAASALSNVSYDMGITVYLGRNGDIAAVGEEGTTDGSGCGVIISCTEKTVDGAKDYYVTCLGTGGEQEFKVKSDKSSLIGRTTRYVFEDGYLKVSTMENKSVYGDLDKSAKKIGSYRLDSGCTIVDVSYVPDKGTASAKKIELSDISRSKLSVADIKAVNTADNGLITFMALNNVSGFDSVNGIVLSSSSGKYKVDMNGTTRTLTSDANFDSGANSPAMIQLHGNKLVNIKKLQEISSGRMKAINGSYITFENGTCDLAKDCTVYAKTDSYEYHLKSVNDIDVSDYTFAQCWSDVSKENGGMARVIVLTPKK